MKVFYSPDYHASRLAMDTTRKCGDVAASLRSHPIPGVELVAPSPATRAELVEVHAPAYVDAVLRGHPMELASSAGIGWDDGLAVSVFASTGGARDAALSALDSGGITGSLSSGLHHARRDVGNGYCTFNGLVVAAVAAIGVGAGRVVIVDLDAHCGGGTASLIADRRGIEQVDVSVVRYDHYPDSHNARLVYADAPTYLATIEHALDGIDEPDSIDLILYNAGVDPHERAGGVAGIDAPILADRERLVFAWSTAHGLPVAFVLPGGYTTLLSAADLTDLHRSTISAAAVADHAHTTETPHPRPHPTHEATP